MSDVRLHGLSVTCCLTAVLKCRLVKYIAVYCDSVDVDSTAG